MCLLKFFLKITLPGWRTWDHFGLSYIFSELQRLRPIGYFDPPPPCLLEFYPSEMKPGHRKSYLLGETKNPIKPFKFRLTTFPAKKFFNYRLNKFLTGIKNIFCRKFLVFISNFRILFAVAA